MGHSPSMVKAAASCFIQAGPYSVKVFWWYDHKAYESENKVSRPNFWSALHSCIISRPWFSVSDIQYAMQITILYLGRCLDLPRYLDNKLERKKTFSLQSAHMLCSVGLWPPSFRFRKITLPKVIIEKVLDNSAMDLATLNHRKSMRNSFNHCN